MWDLNFVLLKFEQHEKTKVLLENSFANGFLELISIPTIISYTSCTDISDHFPICHIIHNKEKEPSPNFVWMQNFNT